MAGDLVRFEDFELDPRSYRLSCSGRLLKLERIPMELLLLLVERRGQLVTREEIIEKLWGKNVFLDTENAINTAIRKIRQVLRDDPAQPRFVQTVTGSGYRFIAPAAEVSASAPQERGDAMHAAPAAAVPTRAHVPNRRNLHSWKVIAPLLVVLGASVLGLGYLVRSNLSSKSVPAHGRVMLAVLPFRNLSDDPEQEYFSDGLTEETITDLGELSPQELGVIARTSAMAYKNTKKSASQIGRELGVDYLLEGSVRREGGRVRISAQLIRAKDQTHVWARNYDREMRDFLGVQIALGEAISRQVQVSLTPERELKESKTRPANPEAYDDFLKGRYYLNKFTVDGVNKSVELFQQAIEKDPGYSQAYAGLAESYELLKDFSVLPPAEAYPKSEAAARKAVELDGGNSEARSALAWQMLLYDRDLAGGEREFQLAIELNPSNADAHDGYAMYFAARGELDQTMAEIKRARELDPLSMIIGVDVARVLFYARQYDQAVQQLHATLDLDPDFPAAHWFLAKVYEQEAMYEEAYEEDFKSQTLGGGVSESVREIQNIHAKSGWKGAREKHLATMLDSRSKGEIVPAYDLAEECLVLGKRKQTLDWLEKAVDERSSQVIFLKVDPRFDSFRSDLRFQALLSRLGLAP